MIARLWARVQAALEIGPFRPAPYSSLAAAADRVREARQRAEIGEEWAAWDEESAS